MIDFMIQDDYMSSSSFLSANSKHGYGREDIRVWLYAGELPSLRTAKASMLPHVLFEYLFTRDRTAFTLHVVSNTVLEMSQKLFEQ